MQNPGIQTLIIHVYAKIIIILWEAIVIYVSLDHIILLISLRVIVSIAIKLGLVLIIHVYVTQRKTNIILPALQYVRLALLALK
jgi:hypothetical protein